MPRLPQQGVVLSGTALRRCALIVLVAATCADARTLRYRGEDENPAPVLHPREKIVDPCHCGVWLQEHSSHVVSANADQAPASPCPCLNTPPPLMTPEQTQAVEVQAAADNAMFKGLTKIQEAAVTASKPVEEEIEKMSIKDLEKEAKLQLEAAEKNQTEGLKMSLKAEEARQTKEMEEMQSGASTVAKLSADHVRETAEQWADNQARNYIYLNANGPMHAAIEKADKTATIRQEATELTKGTIKSAAKALEVAKRAQAAIEKVPKDAMSKATIASKKSKEETKKLNTEIEAIEGSVRQIAGVAQQGYDMAMRTLQEAHVAEVTARKALETSRGNALKIEKLKTRVQAVGEEAAKAKEKSQE